MIALCRPQTVLNLLPHKDKVHFLDFSPAEREMYNVAKSKTVEVLRSEFAGQAEGIAYLNCLKWLNRLRSICNHGVVQTDQSLESCVDLNQLESGQWNATAAQQALQSMVATEIALCFSCSANLEVGSYSPERSSSTRD
jgi:SWI/SNF-related matrix-associated actin-dependent regulator of chromatin subfamily A3